MMVNTKSFMFLLFVSLCQCTAPRQIATTTSSEYNMNSSFEEIPDTNSSLSEISKDNSTVVLPLITNTDINQPDAYFDNNYSEQIAKESDVTTKEFHPGPQYEVNWTFTDKETVRVIFSLFSLSKLSNKQIFSTTKDHNNKLNRYPNMVSIPTRSLQSIELLKYYRFTIRQYKTNTEKVREVEPLIVKNIPPGNFDHFSNSLLLIRLNPKEKYSVCIYYYQMNSSTELPDFIICQDIMHDHLKPSVHGLLFVITQYSIILGMLVVLQSLFSMRKRRLAHILHQHLISRTQRIRSTLSSVSLVRQSFSSMEGHNDQHHQIVNDHINHVENKLKKRIISSPAIVISEPSPPIHPMTNSSDEHEPFLKLTPGKNHVQFLLGLSEGADDNESEDISVDPTLNQQVPFTHGEPYGDRPDALSSMAHILDTNKPWTKHIHGTIPV